MRHFFQNLVIIVWKQVMEAKIVGLIALFLAVHTTVIVHVEHRIEIKKISKDPGVNLC